MRNHEGLPEFPTIWDHLKKNHLRVIQVVLILVSLFLMVLYVYLAVKQHTLDKSRILPLAKENASLVVTYKDEIDLGSESSLSLLIEPSNTITSSVTLTSTVSGSIEDVSITSLSVHSYTLSADTIEPITRNVTFKSNNTPTSKNPIPLSVSFQSSDYEIEREFLIFTHNKLYQVMHKGSALLSALAFLLGLFSKRIFESIVDKESSD